MKTKPTVWDFSVIIFFLLFAFVIMIVPNLNKEKGKYVSIIGEGINEIYDISENEEISINSNGYILVVVIKERSVYISESNCDDNICVNTGAIDSIGDSIVCAPAKVIVYISGGDSSVDHIVG